MQLAEIFRWRRSIDEALDETDSQHEDYEGHEGFGSL
jgi:hypothetical protein